MADEQIVEDKVTDEDQGESQVTEDDLRDLKYSSDGVEDSNESDEPDEPTEDESTEDGTEDGKTDDQAEEADSQEEATFVKEFPNIKGDTLEEYVKELEKTQRLSTAEGKRLAEELAKRPSSETEKTDPPIDTSNITDLYVKQEMDDRIRTAYNDFSKKYPQVADQAEYSKFVNEVKVLSNTILESQGRLAKPDELYRKAAAILDWESTQPTAEDKLKDAVRNNSSASKTSSSTKKTSSSKVTEAMIATNRKMYPGKSDAEIREELEPYIQ